MPRRLFERFYTGEQTGNGTGIGLWVVDFLTERLGGEIFVEVKGNCLYITLRL